MGTISRIVFVVLAITTLIATGCNSGARESSVLGDVVYPEDNPFDNRKVELGRKLFFDTRLSLDNSIACVNCHLPEYAFTDRNKLSKGVGDGVSMRNAPSLLNVAYNETFMFDAHVASLEEQAIVPIQDTNEMSIRMGDLIKRLKKDVQYSKMAKEVYDREFDAWVLTRSLAAFQRTLISDNSPFDRFFYHQENDAISESAKRGWKIFSEDLYCIKCHPAPYFTTYKAENNGLHQDYGMDKGRFRVTGDSSDIGKFKIPSLRNITLTRPYMHDGYYNQIYLVINHYRRGGNGHWNQSELIQPFELDREGEEDLANFLRSLVDTAYMKDFR